MFDEWRIGKDAEGSGIGVIWGAVSILWDWGKSRTISSRIAGLRAEIWARNVLNTKGCEPLGREVLWQCTQNFLNILLYAITTNIAISTLQGGPGSSLIWLQLHLLKSSYISIPLRFMVYRRRSVVEWCKYRIVATASLFSLSRQNVRHHVETTASSLSFHCRFNVLVCLPQHETCGMIRRMAMAEHVTGMCRWKMRSQC
jgi:hypothetical protein